MLLVTPTLKIKCTYLTLISSCIHYVSSALWVISAPVQHSPNEVHLRGTMRMLAATVTRHRATTSTPCAV